MLEHHLDAHPQHQFEARHAAGGALGGEAEQLERRLRRRHPDERDFDRARTRHQPQHRGGDDAERAFRADEQVLEVVAGVVLLELVEVVEHAAVGEHHLDAERVRARDAVGERGGAAGIGREIAADGAGALRRQQLRIEPVDFGGGLARPLQGHAGLAGDGVGDGIDLADAVEPVERQHELAVLRRLSADQAGIAALRHDGGPGLVCELEDGRDLGDRARPQHQRRMPVEHVAHFDEIGRLRLRIGDGVLLAHDRDEAGQQIGWKELLGRLGNVHRVCSTLAFGGDYSAPAGRFPTSCARRGGPLRAGR